MKIIEVKTTNRTYFVNAEEVIYVDYSSAESNRYAEIHFKGHAQDGQPRAIRLTGADADSFVEKLRVAGSVY